jgi:hypothetical protein
VELLARGETDEEVIRYAVHAAWANGNRAVFTRSGANEKSVAIAVDAECLTDDADFDMRIHPVKRADQIKAGEVVHLDGETWHVTAVRVMPGTVRLVLAPRYAPTLTRDTMVEVVR